MREPPKLSVTQPPSSVATDADILAAKRLQNIASSRSQDSLGATTTTNSTTNSNTINNSNNKGAGAALGGLQAPPLSTAATSVSSDSIAVLKQQQQKLALSATQAAQAAAAGSSPSASPGPLLARNAVRQLETRSSAAAASANNSVPGNDDAPASQLRGGALATSTALDGPAGSDAHSMATSHARSGSAAARHLSAVGSDASLGIGRSASQASVRVANDSSDTEVAAAISTASLSVETPGGGGGGGGASRGPLALAGSQSNIMGASTSSISCAGASSAAATSTGLASVARMMETGKLRSITPEDLLAHLRVPADDGQCQPQAAVPGASAEWSQPSSFLLIDMRAAAEYQRLNISRSLCVNFPALLIKRFKRRAVSNFNLGNFIAVGPEMYAGWQQAAHADKSGAAQSVVVVYDGNMLMANSETSEAWAFVAALADGMASDLIKYGGSDAPAPDKRRQVVVAYLQGGFRAFQSLAGASEWLGGTASAAVPGAGETQGSAGDLGDGGGNGSDLGSNGQLLGARPKRLSIAPVTEGGTSMMGGVRLGRSRTNKSKSTLSTGGDDSMAPGSPLVTTNPGLPAAQGGAQEPSASGTAAAATSGGGGTGPAGLAPLTINKKSKFALAIDTQSPVRTTMRGSKSNITLGNPVGGGGGGGAGLMSPLVTTMGKSLPLIIPGTAPNTSSNNTGHNASPLRNQDAESDDPPLTAVRLEMGPLPIDGSNRSLHRGVTVPGRLQNPLTLPPRYAQPQSPDDDADDKDETPTTSPNDNAAPPEPCSRVQLNIFLGSDAIPLAPDAVDQLTRLGVTHILNMAAEVKNSPAVMESGKFVLKWLPVYDNTEQDMDGPLKEAIDFITEAVNSSPTSKVFVHCKAGRSRSVSVVIGYLVSTRQYTLKTAYEMVRKVRKGVSPNLGFMAALMKVERDAFPEMTQGSSLYG
ncbi:hypothetical protein BC831DRAFT_476203 [Entophlyctis helioformis]|nr:hypothetical protein BC831DRAFT_476203 [Entophlyctis helioformis]